MSSSQRINVVPVIEKPAHAASLACGPEGSRFSRLGSNDAPWPVPRFLARAVSKSGLVVTTLFIEPGSPWENGYNESFNGKLCHRRCRTNPDRR